MADIKLKDINGTERTYNGVNVLTAPNANGAGETPFYATSPMPLQYITTAPTSDNTSGGLIAVVLNAEPSTKYNGYLYIVTE